MKYNIVTPITNHTSEPQLNVYLEHSADGGVVLKASETTGDNPYCLLRLTKNGTLQLFSYIPTYLGFRTDPKGVLEVEKETQ